MIFNVQPLYRLRVATFYTAAPPRPAINFFPPTPVPFLNRNGVLSTLIARVKRSPELIYTYPPRRVLVIDPPVEKKIRYYVYDPFVPTCGNQPVVLENGTRVCYLTEDQAKFHVTSFVIGLLPWSIITYSNRKLIARFHRNYFPADLPPVVNAPLVDKTGSETVALTPYQFAANSFWDPDDHASTLTYSAVRVNSQGQNVALPTWLTFTPSTRTFAGTPPTGSAGVYNIKVYATDPWGRSVSDVFSYTISA